MSAVRSHEDLEVLIAIDALDGLDGPDVDQLGRTLAEHGPDCADCAALFTAYADAAAALAVALEPATVGRREEERLLAAARLRPAAPLARTDTPAPEGPGVVRSLDQRRERRNRSWIPSVAVAASLIVGLVAGFAVAPRPPSGLSAFLSFAAQPGTRYATMPRAGGKGQALTVAYRPGESDAWVYGSTLSKPSGGRTYELWFHSTSAPAGKMSPGGLFVPIHGDVIARVQVGSSFDLLAVSVEPPGGSDAPTTQPVYVSGAIPT
jgi:hypothetical protein